MRQEKNRFDFLFRRRNVEKGIFIPVGLKKSKFFCFREGNRIFMLLSTALEPEGMKNQNFFCFSGKIQTICGGECGKGFEKNIFFFFVVKK